MKPLNGQAGLHPQGTSPAPDGVEKGLIEILEIIVDTLYREDILTIGEAVEIDKILRRIKVSVKGSKNKEA